MIKKILIANRGEIAIRIIRTCKEMNIKTVAVYSLVDKFSLHTQLADESICIGNSLNKLSYLNINNIISSALITNSDAIHPGYGFLSENNQFVQMCEKYNIKFIGPTSAVISKIGNKFNAKKIINKIKINTIPGSTKAIKSIQDGINISKKIGFPIILKASYGGGGKGMKIVKNEKEFKKSWESAKLESKRNFNNDDIYLEKFIEIHKHIEIQIIKSKKKIYYLLERDCSIQKKYQKIIEETPSPYINNYTRNKIINATIKCVDYLEYEGIGTIEFILDKDNIFYFIEINPRIQVEHAITEEITGIDIIKLQIIIICNEDIQIKNFFYSKLHAIECRINAENIKNKFYPSIGKVKNLHIPGGHGIRVDTHIYNNYKITYHYDSMILKIIASSYSRKNSIFKIKRALKELKIKGIETTILFHIKLINDKNFIDGNIDTRFIKKFLLK